MATRETHEEIQADHRHRQNEIRTWQEDIAAFEKTARNRGTEDEGLLNSHSEQAAMHAARSEPHERIKKHHHCELARMQLVIDALNMGL